MTAGSAAVLFDLDGTVYRGAEAIPGAALAVRGLVEAGIRVGYVTNNSGATRGFLVDKLAAMGFPVEPSTVFGTGISAGNILLAKGLQSAYVVGEDGLRASLTEAGVEVTEEKADAVLVGICRSFTYGLLAEAMRRITEDGSVFVATNRDATFPLEGGRFVPGAGSIVAAVATASGREPAFTIGKPEPTLIHAAMKALGGTPETTLVVGDRRDTDLDAGRRAGCPTLLVMTGVETDPSGERWIGSVADLTADRVRVELQHRHLGRAQEA